MPGGKTHFSTDWLKLKDSNGCLLSSWCEASKESIFKGYCRLCNTQILCDNQGAPQLFQHSKGISHTKLAKEILVTGKQLTISLSVGELQKVGANLNAEPPSETSTSTTTTTKLRCVSSKDQAMTAELIWALKVVANKFSYSSCDDIKQTFEAMFPGAVPKNFSMSAKKVSYLVSEATGPYFNTTLIDDVNSSSSFYTLEYDETTNKQIAKQLDILIRYWSDNFQCVVSHQVYLLGHATASILANKIIAAVEEGHLSLEKLLMLGSDGPNVNKSVWVKVNELVKELEGRKEGLVNIGTCKLHVVHNCYGKGLEVFGKNISDFVIDIHTWFKLSAARIEDLTAIQEKLGLKKQKFLKHVESRWLTLLPAIVRVTDQWEAILEYFLKYLPVSDSKACSNNRRYLRIKEQLQKEETMVQLHFLKSTGNIFNNFLSLFQKDEPLIHLLYDRLADLIILVFSRFVKKEVIEAETRINLPKIDYRNLSNQLDDKSIDIGEEARKVMKGLAQEKQSKILRDVRNFYEVLAKHMLDKLQLSKGIVRDCRCLRPLARCEPWALQASKNIARNLPVNVDMDAVGDEWRLYQLEKIPEEWYQKKINGETKPVRIDFYWNLIFQIKDYEGKPKYPCLTKVVKMALVLAHGNADVERGFSESGKSVTSQRTSLSEASINGIRSTSDGLKRFGNKPHEVPVTKKFLSMGYSAHAHYVQRLEEEKMEKEILVKKRLEKEAEEKQQALQKSQLLKQKESMEKKEKSLLSKESSEKEDVDLGTSIVKEANTKLKEALKKKDLRGIAIAQALLETGHKKIEEGSKKLEETRQEQKVIEKRKQAMITTFLQPPLAPTGIPPSSKKIKK